MKEMTNKEKYNNFRKELKLLLEKYNAEISCNVDGDTYGVDWNIVIEIDGKVYPDDETYLDKKMLIKK